MEKERELRTEFSREEMAQKVEVYNTVTRDHLKMTLVSGDAGGFSPPQSSPSSMFLDDIVL